MVERAQAMAAHEASVSASTGRSVRWWISRAMPDGDIVEGAARTLLGAAMARAQVLGFQGPRLGTPNRVVGSVKHFAGYGAAEGGRDYDGCYIRELFRNVYLRPFRPRLTPESAP